MQTTEERTRKALDRRVKKATDVGEMLAKLAEQKGSAYVGAVLYSNLSRATIDRLADTLRWRVQ